MKKRRIVMLLLCVLLLVAGCGKKKGSSSATVDAKEFAKELANYVYKAELAEERDNNNLSYSLVAGDKNYSMYTEWIYADGGEGGIPEPRTFEEAAEETEEVEDLAETEDIAEEADSQAKKLIAEDDLAAGEIGDGTEMDDIAVDYEGEGMGDVPSATVKLRIECKDLQGNVVYEYNNEYAGDYNIYGLTVNDAGEASFLSNTYGNEANGYKEEYYINCIDASGNEKWSVQLAGAQNDGEYYYPSNIINSADGVVIVSNLGFEVVDNNGNISGLKKNDAMRDLGGAYSLKDGRVAVLIYGDQDAELRILDVANGTLGDKIEMPFTLYAYNILPGGSVYDIVLANNTGLYYYNIGDAKETKFMDYVASDLAITNINEITMVDANTFYGSYYDDETENYNMYKFSKVDPSTVAEKQLITVGGLWIDSNVRSRAVKFNKTSEQYRIILRDYSSEIAYEDYTDLLQAVNNDIITGKMPDVMLLDQSLNISNYLAKGVFTELDSYIDADNEINKSDYLENVLSAVSYEGKTYAIVPSFSVNTIVAKKSVLGDKKHWNIKEFTEFADSIDPDATVMGLMTKADFVNSMMYYCSDDFIDAETNKAQFDSQEFIDVLKFTDRYPVEIDYNSFDEDYWMQAESFYRENKTFLLRTGLYNFRDAHVQIEGSMGEPVTFVGYPQENGSGHSINFDSCLAINNKSKNKDAAWSFVRQFLLDDYQDSTIYTFPIKKSALEKKAKTEMKPQTYTDENGEEVEYKDSFYIGNQNIEIDPPTQADIDQMMEVLKSADKLASYNDEIIKIIDEEAQGFYNGQKSAEEVAKVIQGRVQIYINETR